MLQRQKPRQDTDDRPKLSQTQRCRGTVAKLGTLYVNRRSGKMTNTATATAVTTATTTATTTEGHPRIAGNQPSSHTQLCPAQLAASFPALKWSTSRSDLKSRGSLIKKVLKISEIRISTASITIGSFFKQLNSPTE